MACLRSGSWRSNLELSWFEGLDFGVKLGFRVQGCVFRATGLSMGRFLAQGYVGPFKEEKPGTRKYIEVITRLRGHTLDYRKMTFDNSYLSGYRGKYNLLRRASQRAKALVFRGFFAVLGGGRGRNHARIKVSPRLDFVGQGSLNPKPTLKPRPKSSGMLLPNAS